MTIWARCASNTPWKTNMTKISRERERGRVTDDIYIIIYIDLLNMAFVCVHAFYITLPG